MNDQVNSITQLNVAPSTRVSQLSRSDKKNIVLQALMDKGFNQNQAATLMCVDRSYLHKVAKVGQKGTLAPLALLARKRVKDVLQGKAIDNTEKAKTSDVLKCVEMVMDRADPKVNINKSMSLSVHAEVSATDRERILSLMGSVAPAMLMAPQDIASGELCTGPERTNANEVNEL